MRIGNNKGQTIIEALVGLGLITIVGFAFTGGMVQLRKTTAKTVNFSSTEKQVNDIAENIKAGVENYQINFNYKDEGTSNALALENLPMAWDVGKVLPRSECKECAGTYGYTIQPYGDYRGLYKVTLRMTHKTWSEPKDYIFVVSAK
ncbi:hypothetical protein QJS83_14005 [Bdellovibrio sp. 22V]|uniref:hypothetical protein n=1 Tax=Bdellovibrio TaxID=958 RepID=UPI0025433DB5|nr:hypothetical protein [Bdellovibrio sp. 22V]WII71579.1 hypothetical protein QJS83_14005 [Bdellovibrio sp. 22V]